MKFRLLIADDETTVRKGLTSYMNWDSIDCEVCGSACDGREAIEFLQKNPVDIVITDIKMPDTDGLEVARYVFENCPETSVIILTGYAEFEYAKTAIQYGVSAFIVKPTNKKDLFKAVQGIQTKMVTSKKNTFTAKEELAFLKEQLLLEMTQHPYLPEYDARLKELGLSLDAYHVAVFQLSSPQKDLSQLKSLIISEKKNAYCYRCGELIISVYFSQLLTETVPEAVLQNCREISNILYTLESCSVTIGISRGHSSAAEFGTAVSEAVYALRANFYSQDNIALFSESCMESADGMTAENSLYLFQLENCLHNEFFEDAVSLLEKFFLELKNNFVHEQDVKNICSQIYYICSRLLIQKGLEAPSPEYLADISNAYNIFALQSSVEIMLRGTISRLQARTPAHSPVVKSAFQYISEHLSEALSLETLSVALHVSPSHLSRVFKKECGESLTEYINKTRISKAQEYLEKTDLLIYEISEQTGYNDVAYFSSIFKKYTGVSPTDYRAGKKSHS